MGILPALEPAHKLSSPQVRMLPQLLFTLMLASALARGPMCSDGVAPTCTCSDGTLATKPSRAPALTGAAPPATAPPWSATVGPSHPLLGQVVGPVVGLGASPAEG